MTHDLGVPKSWHQASQRKLNSSPMRHLITPIQNNFQQYVIDHFLFFEQEYGFRRRISLTDQNSLAVIYENHSIFVNVSLGPPSHEPELSFGRIGADGIWSFCSFDPGDLIQLSSCSDWRRFKDDVDSMCGDASRMSRDVMWLAMLLAKCGRACLTGDSEVYAEMSLRRDAMLSTWTREEEARLRRRKSDAAWQAGDYKAFIEICSEAEAELTPIDRKRLEIARKRT